MTTTRRRFLRRASLAGVSAAVLGSLPSRWALGAPEPATKPPTAAGKKSLLILGGTRFLGPAIVAAAKSRGWQITLFNRGKSNPGLFPELENLIGDRDGKLGALKDRKWDYVVDTSGYVPRLVRDSAALLAPNISQYLFISSISVYADMSKPGVDESGAVGKIADETVEKIDGETYGPLKALSEKAAEAAMSGRATIVRPGLIVGPEDATDRFTYWPVRVARGGDVLAPGTPDDPIQVIDVRDLGEFCVSLLEKGRSGIYNATGPKERLSIGALLDTCKEVSGSDARFVWAPASFLEEQEVSPWSDMPVWLPPDSSDGGTAQVSIKKAVAEGLTFRPLAATVKDTLAWWKGEPEEQRKKMKSGLDAEREAKVLAAWRERQAKAAEPAK